MSSFALRVLLLVISVLGLGFAAYLLDVPVLLVLGVVLVILGGVLMFTTSKKRSPGATAGPTTAQQGSEKQPSPPELSQNVRTK
jgi:hypothetical protein